jgi:hypothetical protein
MTDEELDRVAAQQAKDVMQAMKILAIVLVGLVLLKVLHYV